MIAVLDTEPDQEGISKHDEGDMAIPADVAAHFILIQAKIFAGFQILFNVPTGANGLHDGGQGSGLRSKDQVIGHGLRGIEATAKHQPMALVHGATVEQRQHGPIKEPLPFGPLALTESLPVLGAQGVLPDAGHITEQASRFGLPSSDFGARDSHCVGVSLLLQPQSQVEAVSVDRVGYHPADRQGGRLCSLDHQLGQFGFGLKGDRLRDMSRPPSRRIVAPVFWQIQLTINEGMPQSRHVGEYVE